MNKIAKRIRNALHGNNKGFTLIELLVVIGILAVIGGIVALNVGQFIGRGCTESANIEEHNVQTATIAYMAEHSGAIPANTAALAPYLIGTLKGTYTIATGGVVTQTLTGCE